MEQEINDRVRSSLTRYCSFEINREFNKFAIQGTVQIFLDIFTPLARNTFSQIRNISQFIEKLSYIQHKGNFVMAIFDVENLCINVPLGKILLPVRSKLEIYLIFSEDQT